MKISTVKYKTEINTDETDIKLGIHRAPESIANPKEVIENAIRVTRKNLTVWI